MIARLTLASLAAVVALGCQDSAIAQEPSVSRAGKELVNLVAMTTSDWTVSVLADELRYPWSISVSGASVILTEAPGTIVVIKDGQLSRQAVQTSDPIVNDGGSGLLGMVLATDFATSRTAYLYYTYRSAHGLTNKVVKVVSNGSNWRETQVLLDGIPGHQLYNGGRIAIGPDRQLYVTTGWVRDGRAAQDLGSLAGKVLRMGLNGEVPPDNPFKGSYVFSYGHRNPQGIAWSDAGELLVAEHGESGHDEVNVIKAGSNYGWPDFVGDQAKTGVERPLIDSGNRTWAPSGIAFVQGQLLVATLVGRGLYAHDREAAAMKQIFSSGDRLRDVAQQGDALLVITTNMSPRSNTPRGGDRLLKLIPKR